MERFKPKIKQNKNIINGENNSIENIMSRYNLENFNQIINSSFKGTDEEVDEKRLNDFVCSIDHYFDLYSPDDEEFKEFIKIISLYLTFIAKKPLHPPGITFSNGSTVYNMEDSYYCTGKSIFILEDLSLCEYCVCK